MKTKGTQHFRASDIRAVAQLATQAMSSVTDIVEGVNQAVWSTIGAPSGKTKQQTRGITGLVFKSIQGVTAVVGKAIDKALAALQPLFDSIENDQPNTPQREAVLAALNGVMGDRLALNKNRLATAMTLRYQNEEINFSNVMPLTKKSNNKLVIFIHGLCMNDLQWTNDSHNNDAVRPHEHALTQLGYTPIYVRYNTGLHTSQNGRAFSAQLEQLVQTWPVTIKEITIIAHSMGGLVSRSAHHDGTIKKLRWTNVLKNIVFLGTPHHGAPLERAGNWVDVILGTTPYSAPFAKLGQLRSAGITDLRFGNILDDDWKGQDQFRRKADQRMLVPLPNNVACFTLAATMATKRSALADRLIGDGLVPLRSALGVHDVAERNLVFSKSSQWIAYKMNHMELLHHADVSAQLVKWLS